MTTEFTSQFFTFALLEMMGHRRICGLVSEYELGGAKFLRVDVYVGDEQAVAATHFVPPSSVYCLTPIEEKVARAYAAANNEPILYYHEHRTSLNAMGLPYETETPESVELEIPPCSGKTASELEGEPGQEDTGDTIPF